MMEVVEENPRCYYHPKVRIIGVCAFCLEERLLILASKLGQHPRIQEEDKKANKSSSFCTSSTSTITKVFALGALLHRFKKSRTFRNDTSTSTSLDDSFISIKIEENGRASWEYGTKEFATVPSKGVKVEESTDVVAMERMKSRATKLRWRKRFAYLLQLVRWRRAGKAEESRGRSDRIGTLPKSIQT